MQYVLSCSDFIKQYGCIVVTGRYQKLFTPLFGIRKSGVCVFTDIGDEVLTAGFDELQFTYQREDILVEVTKGPKKGKLMLFKVAPDAVKKLVEYM